MNVFSNILTAIGPAEMLHKALSQEAAAKAGNNRSLSVISQIVETALFISAIQLHTPVPFKLDLLLGVVPMATPWAYFFPPKTFDRIRRSPFSFFRVVPSIGSLQEQESDFEELAQTATASPDEEKEKAALTRCFHQMDKINSMMSFIIGRVGQFLQG